jgi:hypothetical protein
MKRLPAPTIMLSTFTVNLKIHLQVGEVIGLSPQFLTQIVTPLELLVN